MRPPRPSDRPDTAWLVEQLQTATAADLIRIADGAMSWAAIVQATFQKRYPLEYAIWTATVAADYEAATEPPAPAQPRRRH